jgi:hypothetical protein
MPASQICAGVGKSGSPTLKLMISIPWALRVLACVLIAKVAEGLTLVVLIEKCSDIVNPW